MSLILQFTLCDFKMSTEEERMEKLDAELDRCVVAMKTYVLNLQDSSGTSGKMCI